ncbi:7664_t:CDS:2 [Dentiscutata heterogama]|uniref:7664_t:CDS:1 n=1 Tax=Dentiscutata heterogama TaxID=1316150 RepID=A0ACA9JV80_9GLOM|nr:7664_t:CDS:2 [Dentiscutata heterogama]
MNIIIEFLYGVDFNASHDMRTLLDTFSLADEMGIMVLRDGLKSYFIKNIITIMKSNPLLVLEFIKKFILYDDLKEVLLKALCLNLALLFNFGNKEIHENILHELISRSELCLEENLLLSRMIQWLLDTNGFPNKVQEHYEKFKDNNYDVRDGNFCLRSEIIDLDTAKKLIIWISGKEYYKCWYKFELLFNMKHDGLKSETFHKNCDGKGPTIVIIKLLDGDLIGGFNPLDWEGENVWKKTSDSFLFQKNRRSYKKVNIKPGSKGLAIRCGTAYGLTFGRNDLCIQNGSGFCMVKDSQYERLSVSGRFQMASYEPVKLTNGNLVFKCPVPKSLLTKVKYTTSEEFTDIRYTAITCDPDEFEIKKYLIRQKKYKRDTEIMIVITMYNENDTLFIKTMSSVIKNVAYICSKESWGDEGWQKIVMLIVSDGCNKINKRTLNVLSAMGCYQDGIMQDCVKKRAITAHLFKYTTQLMVDNDFNVKGKDYSIPPVQIMFCLKEINAKKLNSHHWSFNAFAPLLNPNICILFDVGTKPSQTSVYYFDPHVSGACREIKVDLSHKCRNLLNPLIASQNFEYKMSNILDKPSEFVFGYISVLPGAFSAYRYKAIINGPLESYFKGKTMHGLDATKTGIFEANMYLAEDRILSFELVIKKNESWKLKYVKSAKAETDVPDNVHEFISQHRRWLNGSFFTAFYSISKFNHIWRSGQPFFRKILLQIQFVYNGIQLIFNWFSLSTTSNPAIDPFKGHGDNLFDAAQSLYLIIIVIIFICSMGNRPQGTKLIYILSVPPIDFKNLSNIQKTLRNAAFRDIIISVVLTYLLYLFSSFIHCEPWHIFSCLVQYLLLVPSYVNIIIIYAFCNTHDISWGTKGDNINIGNLSGVLLTEEDTDSVKINIIEEGEDKNAAYENIIQKLKNKDHEEKKHRNDIIKKDDYYRLFRTNFVLSWIFTNDQKIKEYFDENYKDLYENKF